MSIVPKKIRDKALKNNKVFLSLTAQLLGDCMSKETFELIYNYIDELETKVGIK